MDRYKFVFSLKRMAVLVIMTVFWSITAYTQTESLPFPYGIHIETIPGQCYDDNIAIISLIDEDGNEIAINPVTHDAEDLNRYPLYNIQYHYRNQNTGANTRYDTNNVIQLSASTYCFGVTAYVPAPAGSGTDYIMVDTTICNVEVATNYVHLEASVLSGVAKDSVDNSCGLRNTFACSEQGRIQLYLKNGNLPYHVCVYDENNDTVRTATYYGPEHDGLDILRDDYWEYYTFDSLAAGQYSIVVYDSCEYTLWLSATISVIELDAPMIRIYTTNNCSDSNVVKLGIYHYVYQCIHDYEKAYIGQLYQYRFINPGGDTTEWRNVDADSYYGDYYNNYSYCYFEAPDTVITARDYCDIYNDTIIMQVYDHCQDVLLYSEPITFERYFDYYLQELVRDVTFNMDAEADTCYVRVDSGKSTQSYTLYWQYDYNTSYLNWFNHIPVQFYTCPLSLEFWNENDSTLLASGQADYMSALSATLTMYTDTVIPLHIVVHDAKGCVLYEMHHTYTAVVTDISDMDYIYEPFSNFDSYYCCGGRKVGFRELGVDANVFRDSIQVRLINSPLYNRNAFVATYSNYEWTLQMQDTSIRDCWIETDMGMSNWSFAISGECIPPGHYDFEVTTVCGVDTVSYEYSGFYRNDLAFDVFPYFETEQICNELYVTPIAIGGSDAKYIYCDIDNNEPVVIHNQIIPSFSVIDGVPGGYNNYMDGNGRFVFTVPGSYVVRSEYYYGCQWCYHYDTLTYAPTYLAFDMEYAVLCDEQSNVGNVLTHAYNGSQPYTYYLYEEADQMGNVIATNNNGYFYDVPMTEGQMFSVLVVDSCMNNFYVNVVATSLSQSTLAWEMGDHIGNGHCEGDSAFIAALPYTQDVDYLWTGPNGFSSTDRTNNIYLPYGSESGWYVVELLNTSCQNSIKDSVYIEVLKAPYITLLSDTTICAGTGINLGIAVQGYGLVNFDVSHTGAPHAGCEQFTAMAGDTLYQYYPIWSDNVFWPDNIVDTRCAYHHIVDTTHIAIFDATEVIDTSALTTIDGAACYDYEAVLQASADLAVPYYVYWYASQKQDSVIQCDTILDSHTSSYFVFPHLLNDTSLFVTAENEASCAGAFGTIHHWVTMNDGITNMRGGEGARFYDTGGEQHNYSDNEHYIHTFTCNDRDYFTLLINSLDIVIGDTLFVYEGTANDSLVLVITNSNYPEEFVVNASSVTFEFTSNWTNNAPGWEIDVLTDMAMKEVHAYIIPPYYDTLNVELCQSATPYEYPGFAPIDISETGEYFADSTYISEIGCDSLFHLHLYVKHVSDTVLNDTLMHCQLPIEWNGLIFDDFGTQSVALTNNVGCDSLVVMNLVWAPGMTTILDTTICENDLPLLWHGVVFDRADTVTLGIDTLTILQLKVHSQHLSVSPDCTIRTGDTTLLWVSGAEQYAWSPDDELSSPSSDSTYAFPQRTTIFHVHGSFVGQPTCPSDTSVIVTVIPRNAVDDYALTLVNQSVDIHPLENDTISCATVVPVIVEQPANGTAVLQGTTVTYTPNNGFIGIDHLVYTINCNDTVSTAWIFIMVTPLPDNVDTANCVYDPFDSPWNIATDWTSEEEVSPLIIPLVGDIDNDNIPEIICFAPNYTYDFYGATDVLIFNSISQSVIYRIILPDRVSTVDAAPYGLIKLHNGNVILVVATMNHVMQAYNLSALSNVPIWTNSTDHIAPNINFADFNHDGYPEIYIGNKIYDAETGTLLIDNTSIVNCGCSYAHTTDEKLSAPFAADVVGDINLDLILGNEIYNVIINNRHGTYGNSLSLAQSITPPAGIAIDGHPQVADFNLDGHLDVFVSNKGSLGDDVGFYVWDVFNDAVSTPVIIPTSGSGKSIPLIADVDNDDKLEVVIQCNASTGNKLKTYKYDANSFSLLWDFYVDEDSYSNTMTVFDFNQDGMNELLISDQSSIKIVNGSGHSHVTGNDTLDVYTMTSLSFGEYTVMQYPVIADVNADGSAEIVAIGRFGSGHTYIANLNVFKSAGVPWAPARKVWNQYMYNVTNVNEDLSATQYMFNNATAMTDLAGVVRRPYNNFLQQATTIDQYGKPFLPAPDAAISSNASIQYSADSITVTFSYCNQGDNSLIAPYCISVFKDTYPGSLLITDTVFHSLLVNDCKQYVMTIPKTITCAQPDIEQLVVVVNNAGQGIAQNGKLQGECDTTNNLVSVNIVLDVDSTAIFDTIVENQLPYINNGLVFNSAGVQSVILDNHNGCDSIVTVHLFVWSNMTSELDSTICDDMLPLVWNGQTFTSEGTATTVIPAQSGADSTITMTVFVNPTSHTTFYDTICQHDTYTEYGFDISEIETGEYGPHQFFRHLPNMYNCDSTIELNLLITPLVNPDFIPTPDKVLLSEGANIQFTNSTDITSFANMNYHWSWDYGDGQSDTLSNSYDSEHQYEQWGEYMVTLTLQINQCVTSNSHEVIVEADLIFPNVITPNNDGANDVFIIKNLNTNRPNQLQIFDRWGNKVYDQTNYQTYMKDDEVFNVDEGFNADGLSDGVYYFRFYYEGYIRTIDYNGTITVMRDR